MLPILNSIDVYEGPHSFVLVGHEGNQRRLLHVHRRPPEECTSSLPSVEEEPHAMSEARCSARLVELSPLVCILKASALLGMVRFLEGWYMLFATRHEVAGVISGHFIHRIEETVMISVSPTTSTGGNAATGDSDTTAKRGSLFQGSRRLLAAAASGLATRLQLNGWVEGWAEAKYKNLFSSMDLTRDFYFSYTYDLTNTLQVNMVGSGQAAGGERMRQDATGTRAVDTGEVDGEQGKRSRSGVSCRNGQLPPPRDKFIWNHHLAFGLMRQLKTFVWVPPMVHGFFLQLSASLFGRSLTLTLIGRRSRLFAGARLLKRGLCEAGHVANEVEVEQMVSDGGKGALHSGSICSAVQLRGSIPLVWGHGDQKHMTTVRPDIYLQRMDPTYQFTMNHFDDLYERYAGPIFVFDLVRQAERRQRETILGQGLSDALTTLQAQMRRAAHPLDGGIRYVPFDFKKESKRKGGDVLGCVERIAAHMAEETGFFCSMVNPPADPDTVGSLLPPPEGAAEEEAIRRLKTSPGESEVLVGDGAAGVAWQKDAYSGGQAFGEGGMEVTQEVVASERSLTAVHAAATEIQSGAGAEDEEDEEEEEDRYKIGNLTSGNIATGIDGALSGASPLVSARSATLRANMRTFKAAAAIAPLAFRRDRNARRCMLEGEDTASGMACGVQGNLDSGVLGSDSMQTGDNDKGRSGVGASMPAIDGCPNHSCALQRGVVRTNCIDCLDRTNVAQFCVGRTLLRQQLQTLGFTMNADVLEVANTLLMRMYEELGTQLALQYGGSQAVGTPNSNTAKDFVQSVKRFYRNTFSDFEKQQILNVFLGVFTPQPSGPHIWDLDSDIHLHNRPPAHFYQPFYPSVAAMQSGCSSAPQVRSATLQGATPHSTAEAPIQASGDPVAPPLVKKTPSDFGMDDDQAREYSLFEDFYSPANLTSFDELLSRSYLQVPNYQSKVQPTLPAPAAVEHTDTHDDETSRDAPTGWLDTNADGTSNDHPLWSDTVSWGGQIGYDPFYSSVRVGTIGSGQQVLLPRDYTECDEWHRQERTKQESSMLHQVASSAEAVYNGFHASFLQPEAQLDQASVEAYERWVSLSTVQ